MSNCFLCLHNCLNNCTQQNEANYPLMLFNNSHSLLIQKEHRDSKYCVVQILRLESGAHSRTVNMKRVHKSVTQSGL